MVILLNCSISKNRGLRTGVHMVQMHPRFLLDVSPFSGCERLRVNIIIIHPQFWPLKKPMTGSNCDDVKKRNGAFISYIAKQRSVRKKVNKEI